MARLNSLQLWASDLAASARFYGDFLGFELAEEPHSHSGNEAPHYDLVWGDIASGEYVMLHLAQCNERGTCTTGAEIGVTVEDVDAVHSRVSASGVTVLRPPQDGAWGRNALYEDPDRNLVSVTSG